MKIDNYDSALQRALEENIKDQELINKVWRSFYKFNQDKNLEARHNYLCRFLGYDPDLLTTDKIIEYLRQEKKSIAKNLNIHPNSSLEIINDTVCNYKIKLCNILNMSFKKSWESIIKGVEKNVRGRVGRVG